MKIVFVTWTTSLANCPTQHIARRHPTQHGQSYDPSQSQAPKHDLEDVVHWSVVCVESLEKFHPTLPTCCTKVPVCHILDFETSNFSIPIHPFYFFFDLNTIYSLLPSLLKISFQ